MSNKYADSLSGNYKIASLLEAMFEYYLFYEMSGEMSFPGELDADEHIQFVKECFNKVVECGSIAACISGLEEHRNMISRKMQVLTAYVDRFLVYEYVMNRIEARFSMTEEELESKLNEYDLDYMVKSLATYIFQSEEPVAVNDRIREIIEQLPVRMARSKFLEHLKNSIKLYSDSDVESLDGFLYMIRTVAMIYEPEGMDEHFTGFMALLDEMAKADYAKMDAQYYNILSEKLRVATSTIQDISDVYMSLQRIINTLYTYALNENAESGDESVYEKCIAAIACVNNAFNGIDVNGDELFTDFEGVMEELYEKRIALEAMLGKEISESNELYGNLKKSERLMSTSLFAELDEPSDIRNVDKEYLEKVTDELLKEMQDVIKNNSRTVVRAIYAHVLSKLPVFFSNSNEVVEYIKDSLEQCGDRAELVAVYSLFNDIIMADFDWSGLDD